MKRIICVLIAVWIAGSLAAFPMDTSALAAPSLQDAPLQLSADQLWQRLVRRGYADCSAAQAQRTPGAVLFWDAIYLLPDGSSQPLAPAAAASPAAGADLGTLVVDPELALAAADPITADGPDLAPASGPHQRYTRLAALCPRAGSTVDTAALAARAGSPRGSASPHGWIAGQVADHVETGLRLHPDAQAAVALDGSVDLAGGALYGETSLTVRIPTGILQLAGRYVVTLGQDGAVALHQLDGESTFASSSHYAVAAAGELLNIDADGIPATPTTAAEVAMDAWWEAEDAAGQSTPTPLLLDSFDNPAGGWPRQTDQSSSMEYVDGLYRMRAGQGMLWSVHSAILTDTVTSVESLLLAPVDQGAGAYGVACRVQPDQASGYTFLVSNGGDYALIKTEGDRSTMLVDWQTDTAIRPGAAANRLQLRCRGDMLEILANGVSLAQVDDAAFARGAPALIAVSFDGPATEVLFDNLAIHPAPAKTAPLARSVPFAAPGSTPGGQQTTDATESAGEAQDDTAPEGSSSTQEADLPEWTVGDIIPLGAIYTPDAYSGYQLQYQIDQEALSPTQTLSVEGLTISYAAGDAVGQQIHLGVIGAGDALRYNGMEILESGGSIYTYLWGDGCNRVDLADAPAGFSQAIAQFGAIPTLVDALEILEGPIAETVDGVPVQVYRVARPDHESGGGQGRLTVTANGRLVALDLAGQAAAPVDVLSDPADGPVAYQLALTLDRVDDLAELTLPAACALLPAAGHGPDQTDGARVWLRYAEGFSETTPPGTDAIWPVRSTTGATITGTLGLADGQYRIRPAGEEAWSIAPAALEMPDNFSAAVDVQLQTDDARASYGLVFRAQDDENLYAFRISDGGYVALQRRVDGKWQQMAGNVWVRPPQAPRDGSPVRLMVTARGDHLQGFVDGRQVVSVKDTTFAQGQLGLLAALHGETDAAEIGFDNLVVTTPVTNGLTADPATGGESIFSDDFASAAGGLIPQYGPDWMALTVDQGTATLSSSAMGYVLPAVYELEAPLDLIAEADLDLTGLPGRGSAGLVLHHGPAGEKATAYLLVGVDPGGRRVILTAQNDEGRGIMEMGIPPGLLREDDVQRLRVETSGGVVRIFLNDGFVGEVVQGRVTEPGRFGLFLGTPKPATAGETTEETTGETGATDVAEANQAITQTATVRIHNIRLYAAPGSQEALDGLDTAAAGADDAEPASDDLRDLIDAAQPGAVLELGAGLYTVGGPILLDKAITLMGAGVEETIIQGNMAPGVLFIVGAQDVSLADLTVRYTGAEEGDVLVVTDSRVMLEKCRATGGVRLEESRVGNGLLLLGDSTVEATGCRFDANDFHGIEINETSRLTVTGGVITGNGYSGLAFYDSAGGLVARATITANGLHGIGVYDDAAPTIRDNALNENVEAGLVYFDRAGGVAEENRCSTNAYGIALLDQAAPRLAGNRCTDNTLLDVDDRRGDAAAGSGDERESDGGSDSGSSADRETAAEDHATTAGDLAELAGGEAVVTAQALNVRSGPGGDYLRLGQVVSGRRLPVLGRNRACTWVLVLTDDGPGWVSTSYVQLDVACSQLPELADDILASADDPAAAPTPTARPVQTPAATATPQPIPTATTQAAGTAAPAEPGMVLDFEEFGVWRRGDEAYGDLSQSTEQVAGGRFAAKLRYDFPADAPGGRNYVVFRQDRPIPGEPDALRMQVYGDGSGSFLNIWVTDTGGQMWQFSFGAVDHTGWQEMVAPLDTALDWPVQPVGGDPNAEALRYPLRFTALVLDYPTNQAHSGVIYLDEMAGGDADRSGEAAPSGGQAAPGTDAPATAAPADAPGPLTGRIAFPVLNSAGRYDIRILRPADGSLSAPIPNKRQPDFGPGGLLLANGDGGGMNDLVRMEGSGANPQPVTRHPEDGHGHWAPDQGSFVYASNFHGDKRHRIYLQLDPKTQQEGTVFMYNGRELFGRYPVYLANWRVAYNGCDSWAGGSACGIYSTDGNEGNRPVRATDQTSDIPTDSLGNRILFMSRRSGNWDLYVVNSDGSGLRQLTSDPAQDGLGTASPDGQWIAFVSNRGGSWAIWVMASNGANPRRLLELESGFGAGDWEWIQERISWGP